MHAARSSPQITRHSKFEQIKQDLICSSAFEVRDMWFSKERYQFSGLFN